MMRALPVIVLLYVASNGACFFFPVLRARPVVVLASNDAWLISVGCAI